MQTCARAEARSQKQVSRKVEVTSLLISGHRLCNCLIERELRQIRPIGSSLVG